MYVAVTPRQLRVPQQAPPATGYFAGREKDLVVLDALTHSATRGIAISGSSGMGKTRLALHWLGTHAEVFPGGHFYADLRGHSPERPARPEEILERFLRALGVFPVPSGLSEQQRLWSSLTDGRQVAVVLDNARDAGQVRALQPGVAGNLTMVTSRRKLAGLATDGFVLHELSQLGGDAAEGMFQWGLGRNGRRRVARELTDVRQLTASCDGRPLTVCLASAWVATSSSPHAIPALAGTLTRGTDRDDAVWIILDAFCRSLREDVARAYRLLALLPVREFDEAVVAAVCAVSLQQASDILDALVERDLIEESSERWFRFHDSVLPHARRQAERQETVPARRKAVRRFLDWCLATLAAAETSLCARRRLVRKEYEAAPSVPPPFTDASGALDWLEHGSGWLLDAVRAAADGGWHRMAWQLVDAMWPLFLRRRPYILWIEAHEIGLMAARRAGDREGVVRMLTSGGIGLQNMGRLDEATQWFTDALVIARRRQDQWEEAQALHGLGQSHWLANRPGQAENVLTQALALRERLDYRRGTALTRILLGDLARTFRRLDEARDLLVRARDDLTAEGDVHDAARAAVYLGLTHADAGDVEQAQQHLLLAGQAFVKTKSVPWEARTLEMLGQVEEQRGGTATAGRWYEQSLLLYEGISPRDSKRLVDRIKSLGRLRGGGSGAAEGG